MKEDRIPNLRASYFSKKEESTPNSDKSQILWLKNI